MIYFLVNNDYHLHLVSTLAGQLDKVELGLIQVPYSLNVISEHSLFSKIFVFQQRMYLSLKSPFRILNLKKKISNEIKPTSNDILIVHTERDLANQYIIQLFHEVKAKIYLLEDGTATICHFNMAPKKAALKDRIRGMILKYAFGFRYISTGIYGRETLHTMEDSLFNGVIVNFGYAIKRKIPVFKLTSSHEFFDIKHENGAFFLEQPLYRSHCSEEEYVKFIYNILSISNNFSHFYFKFHPRHNLERSAIHSSITKLICEKFPNVTLVTENDIAENLIAKYSVRYAITVYSTAAVNLINKGVIPIFTFNLYDNEPNDDIILNFSSFLQSIDGYAPKELAEVKPGFCAFPKLAKSEKTYSISEILEVNR